MLNFVWDIYHLSYNIRRIRKTIFAITNVRTDSLSCFQLVGTWFPLRDNISKSEIASHVHAHGLSSAIWFA
jgi:hypothetical protein